MALGLPDAELSILLVNDARMRELNRTFRRKDKTTDILAFSMREGRCSDINPNLLGDIVISLPTAKRQAKEKGHGLYKEISILLVHGMLHLTGYDHEKGGKEEKRMKEKEKRILHKLKI